MDSSFWATFLPPIRCFLSKRELRYSLPLRYPCKRHFRDLLIIPLPCLFILKNLLFVKYNIEVLLTESLEVKYKRILKNSKFASILKIFSYQRKVFWLQTFDSSLYSKFKSYTVSCLQNYAFEKSPFYTCLRIYNKIPPQIKPEEYFIKFKRTSRDYLLSHSFYSVSECLST